MSRAPKQAPPSGRPVRTFRVITDRRPVWEGLQREQGAKITGREDDPAIMAMYQRGWLKVTR